MGSSKWHYTPEDMPWPVRTLAGLWVFQTISILALSIYSIVNLIKPYPAEYWAERYGKGSWWWWLPNDILAFELSSYLLFAFGASTLLAIAVQVFQFRRDRLNPLWMLVTSAVSEAMWFALMITDAVFLTAPYSDDQLWGKRPAYNRYSGLVLGCCFLFLAPLVQLWYAFTVFYRFKARARRGDTEEPGMKVDGVPNPLSVEYPGAATEITTR